MTTMVTTSPPPLPTTNRQTLLDLPQELLDTIVELAWSDLPKPRSLAPCRRLQPCFDRLRFATIYMRGASGMAFYYALQARRAMGEHCKTLKVLCLAPIDASGCSEVFWALVFYWMPALECLDFAGPHAHPIYNVIVGHNAKEARFLPRLRHISFPFNPWTPPDPTGSDRVPLLDHYDNLESLDLGIESWWYSDPALLARPAIPAPPIPPIGLLERLTELDTPMSTDLKILEGLLAQMPRLTSLRLTSAPSLGALNQCLAALPNPDVLGTLDIDFSSKGVPTDRANTGEGFVDGGNNGTRVSLAPFIRRLPGLNSLSFSDPCTCFDADTIAALKSVPPLSYLKLRWGVEMYFEPEVILAFLNTLGSHPPHEVCCDHIEGGYIGKSIRDFLPIDVDEDFPDTYEVYADCSTPEWMDDDDFEESIRRLMDYTTEAGIRLSGSMLEGLEVKAKWKEEEDLFRGLQEAHETARREAETEDEETEEESDQEEYHGCAVL